MKMIENSNVILGQKSSIDPTAEIVIQSGGKLVIGRYVKIGPNVRIIINTGVVEIGDWSTIHANCLLLCEKNLSIGRHCWFGQNSIIDGTGGLTIKDGVRVGMYSQIWTHVAAGERIEGCRLYSVKPTLIEKDVWLVGSCTVGSGITIGEKTICMNGSNLTTSVPPRVTVMGASSQVRERSLYRTLTLNQKFSMIIEWLEEFSEQNKCVMTNFGEYIQIQEGLEILLVCKDIPTYHNQIKINNEMVPIFCVEDKSYKMAFTNLEELLIRWLSGNKARFYPNN